MKNKPKKIIFLLSLFFLWIAAGYTDFSRLNAFETPIFARPVHLADDGGSGTYLGLGWRIELRGNFMPEDEYPGVTYFEYYLFGKLIQTEIRD